MSVKSAEAELNHGVDMFRKYKNLLMELTRKNVKLKYRSSWLGIFWSFLQPLLNMVVLSVVFTHIFTHKNDDVICFPVYLFAGRLMLDFFNTATRQAMTSFRVNQAIIKKVYVPKYMYPLSSIFSCFVTLAISLLGYILVWIFFKLTGISNGAALTLSWRLILVPIPLFLILLFSTGVGLILSVLCVYFRDIEYIWGVFQTLLLYMVPVLYHIHVIKSAALRMVVRINPLYHMIEMFRQCVLYPDTPFNWHMLLYGTITSVLMLVIGMAIFNWKSDDIIFHL
ncbi:MAG: ABC transporter permease [Eubacterium sp.]|nr:ABC transporter permease [Eubacterium sp.]